MGLGVKGFLGLGVGFGLKGSVKGSGFWVPRKASCSDL